MAGPWEMDPPWQMDPVAQDQPQPGTDPQQGADAPWTADEPQEQAAPPAVTTNPQYITAPNRVILEDAPALPEGQDTGIIGEKGGSHTENDPHLAGANQAVHAMIQQHVPTAEILKYLKGRGKSDAALLDIAHQLGAIRQFQAQNPHYKGSYVVDLEHVKLPNNALQDFMSSDIGAGVAAAGNAATAFALPKLTGVVGGDQQHAEEGLAASAATHPASSTIGTVAGGAATALAGEQALGAAGLKEIPAAIGADALYGGTAGAVTTDTGADGQPATLGDRATGAVKGALAAIAGNVGGRAIAKGAGALGSSADNAYVATINDAKIPTTVGQQYSGKIGGIIKRTEDRVAGLPLLGDIINARRAEGIRTFNVRAFDHALKPIGETAGNKVGEEAIDEAQDKISQAFGKALNGKSATADTVFAKDLTNAIVGVGSLPRVGPEIAEHVKVILKPYMKGNSITGEAMQQMSRELRDLKATYYKANDPMKKLIGTEVDKVENAIFGPFRRQAPEVLPEYNRAKAAQRRLYILADSVNKAKNQEGVFMPHHLGQADRSATVKTEGKVNAARGRGQFQALQRAAQQVLPSKIPDSGTAGRLVIPLAVLGAGEVGDKSGLTDGYGLALSTILAAAYSREGQRILTKPGRGIGGATGKVLRSGAVKKALTATGAATGASLATQ
jgi:hypothetical protein